MLRIVFTVTGVVGALAPLLMGWLYTATGGYAWPIAMLALMALLATLAVLAGTLCRPVGHPSTAP